MSFLLSRWGYRGVIIGWDETGQFGDIKANLENKELLREGLLKKKRQIIHFFEKVDKPKGGGSDNVDKVILLNFGTF